MKIESTLLMHSKHSLWSNTVHCYYICLFICVISIVLTNVHGNNNQGYEPLKERMYGSLRDKAKIQYESDYSSDDAKGHMAGAQYACGLCMTLVNKTELLIQRKISDEDIYDLYRASCLKAGGEHLNLCMYVIEQIGDDIITGVSLGEHIKDICRETCDLPTYDSIMKRARTLETLREQTKTEEALQKSHIDEINKIKEHKQNKMNAPTGEL